MTKSNLGFACAIVLVGNLADTYTTAVASSLPGFVEVNPVMRWLIEHSLLGFILFKLILLPLAVLVLYVMGAETELGRNGLWFLAGIYSFLGLNGYLLLWGGV